MELEPIVLEGATLRLQPLSRELFPGLLRAALTAVEVWEHIPYPVRNAEDALERFEFNLSLQERGLAICFATTHREDHDVVGGTNITLSDRNVPSVEIGSTWIIPRWQRTRVNTEAKRLMLGHCFEVLGCARVELKTDARNLRSRAAITRIGATEEGTLRNHMLRADGTLRDSVIFSIIASDWPAVRELLDARLAIAASDADR